MWNEETNMNLIDKVNFSYDCNDCGFWSQDLDQTQSDEGLFYNSLKKPDWIDEYNLIEKVISSYDSCHDCRDSTLWNEEAEIQPEASSDSYNASEFQSDVIKDDFIEVVDLSIGVPNLRSKAPPCNSDECRLRIEAEKVAAVLWKLRIENEKKTKEVKEETRSVAVVGTFKRRNPEYFRDQHNFHREKYISKNRKEESIVHCKKLYELNKEKNAIGKQRREEIKKKIAIAHPRPLDYPASSMKKIRGSEKASQGQLRRNSSSYHRAIKYQSSRNMSRSSRITSRSSSRNVSFSTQSTIPHKTAKDSFVNGEYQCASQRMIHLYESGKRKLRTERVIEAQAPVPRESSTECRIHDINRRCKELYQLSEKAQQFGRQRRQDIKIAAETKAKINGTFRLLP